MRIRHLAAASIAATAAALALTTFGSGSVAEAGTVAGHIAGFTTPATSATTQSASVTFVVPGLTCPAGNANQVFQDDQMGAQLDTTGPGSTSAGVLLGCSPAGYRIFGVFNGTPFYGTFTVTAGDTVTATASESATASTVTVTSGSHTWNYSKGGGTVTAEDVGYFAVNCTPSGCTPIPETAKTQFTAATINGKNLGTLSATRDKLVDNTGKAEMKTSKKTSSGSFKTTWVFSCGTTGYC